MVAEWGREANRSDPGTVGGADLREMLDVLGLASLMESGAQPISGEVAALRDAREGARQARDWAEAPGVIHVNPTTAKSAARNDLDRH